MKKQLFLIAICTLLSTAATFAQKPLVTKFSFSGYKVNIVYSDSFRVKMSDDVDVKYEKEFANDVLSYSVTDQTGKAPKGEVTIFTNCIEFLELHNSVLVIDSALALDELEILASSSIGTINVNAKRLNVTISAGSNFTVIGKADTFICNADGASNLNAQGLKTGEVSVDAQGYSNVTLNSKEVTQIRQSNSSIENVHHAARFKTDSEKQIIFATL